MAASFDRVTASQAGLIARARIVAFDGHPDAARLAEGAPAEMKAPRQVVEVDVEAATTSCGYGVPVMELAGERDPSGRGRKYD